MICHFFSCGFLFLENESDKQCAGEMRRLISRTVRGQPSVWSEAILGKTPAAYCKWIECDDSWGGGIELAILSQHYNLEIDVVDTQHGIVNRFGEDKNFIRRIVLIYDGIHYDPLYRDLLDVS